MIGNYQYSLDSKGRLAIPSKFRKELGTKIVLSLGFDQTLEIRREIDFKNWTNFLLEKSSMNKNSRLVSRTVIGNSFEVSLDGQGRILLPKLLLEQVGINKKVQIVGVGNKLELHSQDKWEKVMKLASSGILEEAAEKI